MALYAVGPTTAHNTISSADVDQYKNLLTGVMTDQPVTISNTLKLTGDLTLPVQAASSITHADAQASIAAAATTTITFAGVSAGDLLVCEVRSGAGTPTADITVSDPVNGTWIRAAGTGMITSGFKVSGLFYVLNSLASASMVVTCTCTGSTVTKLAADRFNGIGVAFAVVDSVATQSPISASTTIPAGAPLNTVPGLALIYAAYHGTVNSQTFAGYFISSWAATSGAQSMSASLGWIATEYVLSWPVTGSSTASPLGNLGFVDVPGSDTIAFIFAGPPTGGTRVLGETYVDSGGRLWVCNAAGTPGNWVSSSPSAPDIYQVSPLTSAPRGIAGATQASRYVGASASGAPTVGTFVIGDVVVDRTGWLWVCTVAGSPGSWKLVGSFTTTNPAKIQFGSSSASVALGLAQTITVTLPIAWSTHVYFSATLWPNSSWSNFRLIGSRVASNSTGGIEMDNNGAAQTVNYWWLSVGY